MEAFRNFIEKYTPLSDADWSTISSCFERRTLRKEEVLLAEGKICRHLYFVETGMLRYYINKDGKDITKFFTQAPYCFTSQASFVAGRPARESIQAIEDCLILQTTLKNANDLLELRSWSTFVRKLIQEVQHYTEELLQDMQTETAESRYAKLLNNNATLLQRIPLKYLSTYLGIAPQSLSRIRNKLAVRERS